MNPFTAAASPVAVLRRAEASRESSQGEASSQPIPQATPSIGTDRIVGAGRLTLAAYWLLTSWLDPQTIDEPASILVAAYVAYAALRVALAWRAELGRRKWQIARHVVDLVVFALLSGLTSGASSPFFLGFVFSIIAGALVFRFQGTLRSAIAAWVTFVVVALATAGSPYFELHRFIGRSAFLVVVMISMLHLKFHEARLQSAYARLSGWPRGPAASLPVMLSEMLQHAVALLGAPRVLLIWEREDDSVMTVAEASAGGVTIHRVPARFEVVDRTMRLKSFLSASWLNSPAARADWTADAFEPLPLHPIHEEFRKRYRITQVVASRFFTQNANGWLFVLDKPSLSASDVVLTDIVAGLIESRFEQFYLAESIRESATAAERGRLARDLHDGILQSLSGTALHLSCLERLLDEDPAAASFRLKEVEETLAGDQRDLRSLIMRLRSSAADEAEEPELQGRLMKLGQRIQRDWGLKVTVETTPLLAIAGAAMAEEIYGVVKEALTNAAIHSNANRVAVEVTVRDGRVRILIADNGHGFKFRGRFDLATLASMKRGPMTLKERIAALGGNLIVESREDGAKLEVELPLALESEES